MDNNLLLGQLLTQKKLTISVAESCTGGLISKLITDIPNSSKYFLAGIVSYSNDAKVSILGVDASIIEKFGAVSSTCADAMVRGLRNITKSDICLSTTGIAGPGGGTFDKPVGLVYAGIIFENNIFIHKLFFRGNREQIRLQTANFCLKFIIEKLKNG